ncbi:nucleoporin-domain-containing protein [Auriculariales sp. MPI-PUGE-AT-0066]|nr:nucleoporin-domain-containing protein [Auriculariales sp. MPI-PUGE-AT-0066]
MFAAPGSRRFQAPGLSQSIWSLNTSAPAPPAPLVQPATPKSAPPPLAHMERASRVLLDMLTADNVAVPELADMLQTHPQVPYSSSTDKSFVPFYKKRTVNIPDDMFNNYHGQTQYLGILPEIGRAWMTLGNKLFLWDYHDGQDLNTYADQPNLITHISLVKPRPGVFVDDLKHLLVICTPVSVFMLGVGTTPVPGTSRNPRTELKLYSTDMHISTEGNEMAGAVGTKNGRIFLYGRGDGGLYELVYKSAEAWFGKKVELKNHLAAGYSGFLPFLSRPESEQLAALVVDDDRNCLYALSTQQSISLYSLGLNGEEFRHIKTLVGIRKRAQALLPGLPALSVPDFEIRNIHIVDVDSARNIHLVGITNTGVRLYFSHYRRNPIGMGVIGAPALNTPRIPQRDPSDFDLVQVRPPPIDLSIADGGGHFNTQRSLGSEAPVIFNDVLSSCHCAGLTLAAQGTQNLNDPDLILCIAPDLTKIINQTPSGSAAPGSFGSYPYNAPPKPPLVEYATALHVGGLTWAMAETRRPNQSWIPPSSPPPNPIFELATQFSEPPRQFLIFTNAGLSFFVKRRAVDQLRHLLEQYDNDARSAQLYCQSFGRLESAAMLLAVAAGNTFIAHEGNDLANLDDFSLMAVSPDMSLNAKLLFYAQGGAPLLKAGAVTGSQADTQILFSGRRDGFALYFARLVRPIWRALIVRKGDNGRLESNVFDSTLVVVQKNLEALRSFLERNPTLFQASTEIRDPADQEAWKIELASVSQLQGLLSQTVEAISFVLLLIDYQLSEIVAQCDQPTRDALNTLSYDDLISSKKGRDVARGLVNAIINHQIAQQTSVDTISELLQQRCGSFCSTDDVLMYKAIENLRKAKETRDATERNQCLRTSYKFFAKGSAQMELSKLTEIVAEYKNLRFAKGVVELPLQCARDWDIDGHGYTYWVDGSQPNDPRGEFFQKRLACYELIVDALENFNNAYKALANAPPTVESEELRTLKDSAYQSALSSQDDAFHSYLYDRMLKHNQKDEMVELATPFIEGYLRRPPITLERADLLHLFYVRGGQYLRAAETCAALAESTDFDLSLERRIQLFTFAVNYVKSHTSSELGRQEAGVEFLSDLEEKLEVAQVQLEIYNDLLPRYAGGSGRDRQGLERLNGTLMNITELFTNYADPYNLLEVKLLILHVSDHNDAALTNAIWDALFERVVNDGSSVDQQIKAITAVISRLGQRFYPSESSFPLEETAMRLEQFALDRIPAVHSGWVPRVLLEAGVPFSQVFDILHKLYESQIPPFHQQAAVQWLSGDVAVLVSDWVTEAIRPQSSIPAREFPANAVDETIDVYLRELSRDNVETRRLFEQAKSSLRRYY